MIDFSEIYSPETKEIPFSSYQEYTDFLFAAVDRQLSNYIRSLMNLFANDNGGFKNVLYPDIEIAHDLCERQLSDFYIKLSSEANSPETDAPQEEPVHDELDDLFAELAEEEQKEHESNDAAASFGINDCIEYIRERAQQADESGLNMPFYKLCKKLELSNFAVFCFACAVLSSTQTNYASVFQVVNQNGNLSAPTI